MSVMESSRKAVETILAEADVRLDGTRPFDLVVHDPRFYQRVLRGGSLALGESYMDGWWDCEKPDEFFFRVLRAELDRKANRFRHLFWPVLKARLVNLQGRGRAFQVGRRHYDLGNDLFETMLDKRMVYSCAYWKDARTLDEAQEAKLDLICRKIGLRPGMRVLDIGCGWGGFAIYAAERYGVSVVGITVSREQARLATERSRSLPVEIRVQDYRDLDERFDRVVSVGMVEHVGYRNYRTFLKTVHRCLAEDGLFLLHTIGNNVSVTANEPWTERYIFPNGMLPSLRQLAAAAEGLFVLEDFHGFGPYYDTTLMAWHENFLRGWDKLRGRYDDRFYRMWRYFLLSSAGSFRARKNQVWQLVYSKHGVPGGYESIR